MSDWMAWLILGFVGLSICTFKAFGYECRWVDTEGILHQGTTTEMIDSLPKDTNSPWHPSQECKPDNKNWRTCPDKKPGETCEIIRRG